VKLTISLPQGWATRINQQKISEAVPLAINGTLQLPDDPGGGPDSLEVELENDFAMPVYAQIGEGEFVILIRRTIAAILPQDREARRAQSRLPRFDLRGTTKEALGLIVALVIPLIVLALLIWLLGRGAKAGSGFAEWTGGTPAA
jgi:hypothetical protein